jgi:hypothetical protein
MIISRKESLIFHAFSLVAASRHGQILDQNTSTLGLSEKNDVFYLAAAN